MKKCRLPKKKIAPRAGEVDGTASFPHELTEILGQNRLLSLLVPKEQGGEGAGFMDFCIVIEEISKVCPTSAVICTFQNMGSRFILKNGKESHKSHLPQRRPCPFPLMGFRSPEGMVI